MSRWLLLYILIGMCTSCVSLVMMLRVFQSGVLVINERMTRHKVYIFYVSAFVSALQAGACWPLYWSGALLAKAIGSIDDGDEI